MQGIVHDLLPVDTWGCAVRFLLPHDFFLQVYLFTQSPTTSVDNHWSFWMLTPPQHGVSKRLPGRVYSHNVGPGLVG